MELLDGMLCQLGWVGCMEMVPDKRHEKVGATSSATKE